MSRWYIIHAYSGFENKVRDAIMSEATRLGLDRGGRNGCVHRAVIARSGSLVIARASL